MIMQATSPSAAARHALANPVAVRAFADCPLVNARSMRQCARKYPQPQQQAVLQAWRQQRAARQAAVTAAALPTAEPADSKVGFVGLGIMGYAMANNLLKAGYSVTVWNRTMEKCDALAGAGAAVANTPAEVMSSCDITLAMLADPAAAVEVATGQGGIVEGTSPGKAYIDISTVDAATSRQIAAAVRSKGGLFLEAPVSGSKGPAEQGQLIFLAAGDREAFDAALPLLDVMGKASFYLGEVGAGAHMKLVVNMMLGSLMASFAEGLALAEAAGLSQQDFLEVIKLGAIAAPMFSLKGPMMIEGKHPPAFPLKHQQKDLRLVLELGEQHGQQLPVAAAVNELFKEAQAAGHGDADFSAVLEAVLQQRKERKD